MTEKPKRPRGRPPGKKQNPDAITFKEIAEMSGISEFTIHKWAHGVVKISEDSKAKIDRAVGAITRERKVKQMDSIHREWRKKNGLAIVEDSEDEGREDADGRRIILADGMRYDGADGAALGKDEAIVVIEGERFRYDQRNPVASINEILDRVRAKYFADSYNRPDPAKRGE